MRPTLFCLAAAALLLTVSPARADLTFNFQDHKGLLGTSQDFSAGGYTITANGLTINQAMNNAITGTTALFVKSDPGDESGLGTNLGTDHEIVGQYAVNLNLSALESKFAITSLSFKFGSVTGGDTFVLYAGSFGSTPIATGTSDSTVTLTGPFAANYYIKASEGNILLNSITVAGAAVPEPASMAMMGLGIVGSLAGYQIKRRKAITA